MPNLLTKAQLAERWHVSRAAVTKLFARPGAPEFDGRLIDAAVADEWRDAGSRTAIRPDDENLPEITESRKRAEAYKARLLELECLKAEGELIERSQVEELNKADAAAFCSKLNAMPSLLTPALCDAGSSAIAINAILAQWVRDTLTDLSQMMDG